jgi:hypothetical protein
MTFDPEFLQTILGILSIFGATASGVMALLVEYKDKKTGRMTKWGRYALCGLAISFLIGTSNLWIDYTQKSRKTRDDAERSRINTEKTLQIVTDINRTLNPFKDVRVTFAISYPFDHPDLARYLQRLDEGVRALLPDMQSSHEEIQGVSWQMEKGGRIVWVRIHEGSPLFPSRSSEPLAFQVFLRRGLTLNFFKTPISPSTFDLRSDDIPDIRMSFDEDEYKNEIEVRYDLESKAIEFVGYGILSKPESWESSGKIVSMLDLPGTQLIIQLEYDAAATVFATPRNLAGWEHLERINLPHSIDVDLAIADRRSWHLPQQRFELYKGPRGTTNFVYSFPNSYEEILTETE